MFNKIDPTITAQQIQKIYKVAQSYPSIPAFFPDIYSITDIERYYDDHT